MNDGDGIRLVDGFKLTDRDFVRNVIVAQTNRNGHSEFSPPANMNFAHSLSYT